MQAKIKVPFLGHYYERICLLNFLRKLQVLLLFGMFRQKYKTRRNLERFELETRLLLVTSKTTKTQIVFKRTDIYEIFLSGF